MFEAILLGFTSKIEDSVDIPCHLLPISYVINKFHCISINYELNHPWFLNDYVRGKYCYPM